MGRPFNLRCALAGPARARRKYFASVFLAATLLYPCALVALCLGAGLLVERASGGLLAAGLLLPVGAAALIAVSQLSTLAYPLATATPYLILAVALAGFAVAGRRLRAAAVSLRARPWLPVVSVLAFLLALAPVLAGGRTSFSSYMALADSAVHMAGADYLLRHGQHFAHLDLHNSYGQFINDYYNSSYPSGADTSFAAGATLLGLPLIWAFQPFNAVMLALTVGPALLIARRLGLTGIWGALAALAATVPALVYAYELLGSVKEITALPLILATGALAIAHRDWLQASARRVLPLALLIGAGLSTLGIAFGVWALPAALVIAAVLVEGAGLPGSGRRRSQARLLAAGAGIVVLAALSTWLRLKSSVAVAQGIAATSNPGNLHRPLRASQSLGIWLNGSYKLEPHGLARGLTGTLIVLALGAAVLGVWQLLRTRAFALGAWISLMLLAWVAVTLTAGTWAGAKALMLSSPLVVLLAWGGVATLRSLPARAVRLLLAPALALVLLGGVLASDAMQYHASNLAPTARYEELASLDARFAGQGPTLFTDFDEYSLYELRDLDVGGPDFAYPPSALARLAGGYGRPVRLERASPAALASYPLIVTRRDPLAARPPAAYRLVWQGSYYQVWRRSRDTAPALRHLSLTGPPARQCKLIGALAMAPQRAQPPGASPRLLAAPRAAVVQVDMAGSRHPRDWGHQRGALVMNHPGTLSASLRVPSAGHWLLWLRGQLMPDVRLRLDGARVATVGGQLSGNSLVLNTVPPFAVQLSAGTHRLTLTRGGLTLGPGDGGAAVIGQILLSPAAAPATQRSVPAADWRALCGRRYSWVELISARRGGGRSLSVAGG
jgi:hypothetical protein